MIKPKRRHQNSRRAAKERSCPAHLAWVRGFNCIVNNADCDGRTEAMHVRTGTDGGMGLKPSDAETIPGCTHHHREQHQIGERAFERKYGIDMKAIAGRLWQDSRAGKKYRREREAEQSGEVAWIP